MRSVYFVVFLIGLNNAAVQQIRSPVYPSTSTSGASPPNNQQAMAKSLTVTSQTAPASPAQTPTLNQPTAQPRESGPAGGDTSAASAQPSQNYLVYYYPDNQLRAGLPSQGTGVQLYGAPPAESGVGIWNWSGWTEVGYAVAVAVLVGGGGVMVYNSLGSQVKARAIRELQDLKLEDLNAVTTRIMKAMEHFQNLNSSN